MPEGAEIVIIEFGGQYTHLISRRTRDLGVLSRLIPHDEVTEESLEGVKGIILSGGPRSVGMGDSIPLPSAVASVIGRIPVLGICYGHQLLADHTGGVVSHSKSREYGPTEISVGGDSAILPETDKLRVWMSHSDFVSEVGEGMSVTASSSTCPVVAMEDHTRRVYGVQFHPEVTHTEQGKLILRRFIIDICGCDTESWSMASYRQYLIDEIRAEVGEERVLLGVSGGVDSTVAALVLKEAVGDSLHLVFVDHGLLRKDEAETVSKTLGSMFDNFHVVDASGLFLERLGGVTDPEEKRKIIGFSFIEVFEEKARELRERFGNFEFLGQGTIYSDRVESGAAGAETAKIKSHHNLTLPEKMEMRIIEPLKELYKDEVRELGILLGAPEDMIQRFPFPGPGLAVRIIGEVTAERLRVLREADAIFMDELYSSGLDKDIWQAFAVLLPVNAVGVQGDNRVYGQVIALRAVTSSDGMTADFGHIPHNVLSRVSSRIINEVPEITRVVYDVSTKPPATIEWE